jgi:hypothetical protein
MATTAASTSRTGWVAARSDLAYRSFLLLRIALHYFGMLGGAVALARLAGRCLPRRHTSTRA